MKIEINDSLFNEEELANTPGRVSRFFSEWFSEDNKKFNFTTFPTEGYKGMVVYRGENFYSMCSHHLLPVILKKVYIGYIPDKKVCGLSKMPRLINFFAHKPTLQEKLTKEIVEAIEEKLHPLGVICMIEGAHLCMLMRGCRERGNVITSEVRGIFNTNKDNCKDEFFKLVGL
jgi:GTP cyclohydrolase IA